MRSRFAAGLLVAILAVLASSCESDPLASAGVVSRTVSHDLTVQRLSMMLSGAKPTVSVTRPVALVVSGIWSSYTRLAHAAAIGDTLMSHVDAAVSPSLDNTRVGLYIDKLRKGADVDSATQARYDSATYGLYSLRHILIRVSPRATPQQVDSARAKAVKVRKLVTPQNWNAMVLQYSDDTASAKRGGSIGVFRRQDMNPPVAAVVTRLKPDSISIPVQTQVGFEIIQRETWANARPQYTTIFNRAAMMRADSIASERIATAANLKVENSSIGAVRDAAEDPANHATDSTVVATFDRGGHVTIANMLAWVNTMQPYPRNQVLTGLPGVQDSIVRSFVRTIAMRAVALRAADSAGITLPDTLKPRLVAQFRQAVVDSWKALNISPEQLGDSARTPADRERIATARVQRLLERGLAGEIELPPVPIFVESALDAKYPTQISYGALQKALDEAQTLRKSLAPAPGAPDAATPARPDSSPAKPGGPVAGATAKRTDSSKSMTR